MEPWKKRLTVVFALKPTGIKRETGTEDKLQSMLVSGQNSLALSSILNFQGS